MELVSGVSLSFHVEITFFWLRLFMVYVLPLFRRRPTLNWWPKMEKRLLECCTLLCWMWWATSIISRCRCRFKRLDSTSEEFVLFVWFWRCQTEVKTQNRDRRGQRRKNGWARGLSFWGFRSNLLRFIDFCKKKKKEKIKSWVGVAGI